MHILQTVIVKQVLTEKSKKDIYERFMKQREKLKAEIEQLQFQSKHMQKQKTTSSASLQAKFERENSNRLEKIRILDFQIAQLDKLSIGSELVDKELEALVEVKLGDSWEEIQHEKTIVIKDGIVVEIR